MEEAYLYMVFFTTIVLFGLYIILSGQYGLFGLRQALHKIKYKSNSGLIFLVNKSGNFGVPRLINLGDETFKTKVKGVSRDYPINNEQLQKGTFWGRPFIIYNIDDVKTNIGIYYQKCDSDGYPLFLEMEDEKGNTKMIPNLSPLAPSISLSPTWLDALVGDRALTDALKQLFSKHKTLLYILGGIAIATAFNVYVAYELSSAHIPAMLSELRGIKELIEAGGNFRP
jgi:hypothetical protein